MSFAIITVPAAPVRRKARHQAEMVNQLLFGEAVAILKQKNERWFKVRSLHDGYEGWLTSHMITIVKDEEAKSSSRFICGDMLTEIEWDGQTMWIPAGACLPGFNGEEGIVGELKYKFKGKVIDRLAADSFQVLEPSALSKWLNVPYLWGGRTLMGIDCSGFVQILFRLTGIDLPRDAWQQAQEGREVKKLSEAQLGDLAFFDDKDEIVHVGILLSSDKIIHAAGKVRIDTIDKKGIIHSETGKRTHKLKIIKRAR